MKVISGTGITKGLIYLSPEAAKYATYEDPSDVRLLNSGKQ